MKRSMSAGICLVVLLAVAAATALAQSVPKTYDIFMGGYLIMRIRTGSEELSIKERRLIVQQRVTDLMKCTDTGDIEVTVTRNGNDYNIVANNVLIITVSSDDAHANKTTTFKQAEAWARNIRETFPKAATACKPPAK
jgi:hypothetical protein